jgi:mono/diheme cytochrome c family protein
MMSTLAVDAAVSPDGSQIAIASPGNAHTTLPQLQTTSFSAVVAGGAFAPCLGTGTPVSPGMIAPEGQVVAVSYASNGTLFAQTREPAQLWSSDGGAAITLTTDLLPDTGHLIFHANSGSGIACASCHPEGGEDGRVWNFACLGARRTQSLRGRLSETAPFHWDGDMNTFPKLVDEVFVGRMAGPKTTDVQNMALLHWLDRVPELPAAGDTTKSAAVERGRALFEGQARCGTCHMGSHLTNNLTVDVGTGAMLQVPSLKGVAWRAPFLHDGRAATLLDRFDARFGASDKHGLTSQLRASNIADLTAYLETL